jgi:lipopolysaccharide transport system permease protein
MIAAMLRPLWSYRGFISGSVKREFQLKYQNSMLGALWLVIQPLSMILVYTVIFSQVMRAKLPGIESGLAYSIYLCSGIITWALFAEITGRGQNVFLEHANLLKKLSFPRLCLPTIIVINSLLNFSIIFSIFLLFLLTTSNFPGLTIIATLPLLVLQVAFSIGLGITLGVLNVFFRDVGHLFNVVLQFWFWLTPIVYPATILPEWVRDPLFKFNPMAPIVAGYQNIFVYNLWPDWQSLIIPLICAIVLCRLGLRLFRKHSGEMVDEL